MANTITKTSVAVIGMGSWGTALADVFADAGASVLLWGRDTAAVQSIKKTRENAKYLKGFPLSKGVEPTSDLEEALTKSSVIICSIPTQQIRQVFAPKAKLLTGKHLVNTSKGIEIGTHKRVSGIFKELNPNLHYSVLSGPSFAEEVMKRLPTAVTVASERPEDATELQRLVSTPYFRAYTSKDVAGVEFAGALKNVIAIASGMVSGLQLGYNAQAALINRGVAEILKMSRKENADPMTFLGLAGMGDLILTCTGPLSRNRRVGILLGEGKKLDQIQRELGGVAEGVYTANSAFELAKHYGIEMPITEQIYRILYEGSTPQKALAQLMSRDLKEEW